MTPFPAVLISTLSTVSFILAAEVAPAPMLDREPRLSGRDRLLSSLELLWAGNRQERLEVADSFVWMAALETSHPEYDAQTAEYVVESLRQFLRVEEDDWIANRFADSLILLDDPPRELLREALLAPSANVRWKAIHWYVDNEDASAVESLERLWSETARPWEKSALIEALARQGSLTHVADFRKLVADKENRGVAAAAIRAVGALHDAESIAALVNVLDDGPRFLRLEALDALGSFPDSEKALEAVLRASRVLDPKVSAAAVGALALFEAPAATERLLEVARSGRSPSIRASAVRGLESAPGSEVTAVLVDVLRERSAHEGFLTDVALQVLRNRDDSAAVPALLGLDQQLGGEDNNVGALVEYLSRDRERVGGTYTFTSACSLGVHDPEDPATRRVRPPRGLETIRCWESPGAAGDPEDFLRLRMGSLVEVTDYFDEGGELWVETESGHPENCWVPMRLLEDADGGSPKPAAAGDGLRLEFDLPADQMSGDAVHALLEAGLLEIIEPGEAVIGVALTVDPRNHRDAALIGRLNGVPDSILGACVSRLAHRLAPRYRDDAELGRLLASRIETEEDDFPCALDAAEDDPAPGDEIAFDR